MDLLLSLPSIQSKAFRVRLLRFLRKRGEKLLWQEYYGQTKGLKGVEILLDRYFTAESVTAESGTEDVVMTYLSPLIALLEGIAAQGMEFNQSRRSLRDDKLEGSLASIVFDILQLSIKAKVYAEVSDNINTTEEISEAIRDKVFASKNIQDCLPMIANCAFSNPGFRKGVGVFEEKVLSGSSGAGESGVRLYFSLLSGFGEAVHKRSLFTSQKKTHGKLVMDTVLLRCLALTFLDLEPLHVNHYVVSYLAATFKYLIESLVKDQYSFPDCLARLPSKLKSALSRKSSYICHPEFFRIIEIYLGLFEEQIMNILTAFNCKSISKDDLNRLDKSPEILHSLNKIAQKWGLEVCRLSNCFLCLSSLYLSLSLSLSLSLYC